MELQHRFWEKCLCLACLGVSKETSGIQPWIHMAVSPGGVASWTETDSAGLASFLRPSHTEHAVQGAHWQTGSDWLGIGVSPKTSFPHSIRRSLLAKEKRIRESGAGKGRANVVRSTIRYVILASHLYAFALKRGLSALFLRCQNSRQNS